MSCDSIDGSCLGSSRACLLKLANRRLVGQNSSRLLLLSILLKPGVSKPLYPLCWATFGNGVLCKFFFSSSSFCLFFSLSPLSCSSLFFSLSSLSLFSAASSLSLFLSKFSLSAFSLSLSFSSSSSLLPSFLQQTSKTLLSSWPPHLNLLLHLSLPSLSLLTLPHLTLCY